MTSKYDVDQLANAIHEFLLATEQKKDIKFIVREMRKSGESEESIAKLIAASLYDKLAYGN